MTLEAVTIGGAKGGTGTPPLASKFFRFHAILGNIWQNHMLAPPPLWSWRPHLREILDPPLVTYIYTDSCEHLHHFKNNKLTGIIRVQWRIQDLSEGGCQLLKSYYFAIFLPKTLWQWKNLAPRRTHVPGAHLAVANAMVTNGIQLQ